MTANIKVPSLNVLNGLQNHKNGEIAYVVATDAYYQYNDDGLGGTKPWPHRLRFK